MKRSVGVVEVELVGVSVNEFVRGRVDGFVKNCVAFVNCVDGFVTCDDGFVNWDDEFINSTDELATAKSLRTYTNMYALVTRSSK